MDTININSINFNLTEYIISLVLMLIFLSFIMEGFRFFFTDSQELIQPPSTTNETINVLKFKIPKWLEKLILASAICFSIIIIRGMFNLPVSFKLNAVGYRSMFEMGIALGFLEIGYTIAGPIIAKGLTLRLLKKYKFNGMDVITDDEYMALGKNN